MIARHFENRLDAFPNVDGVVALTHKSGCGMASEGEPMDVLRRTMAGYARHPNFFAVQVVGLGCEANQINSLLSTQQLKRSDRLAAYTIQEKGGTMKAVREGIARIEAILPEANRVKRETVPASHLLLALQCGGSDGYSGITANPALGAAVDLLVRHGGGAILSETPEIYGAEHLLTRRALTREVGEKLIHRIKWWEDYTARNGNEMNNNPSPGNKAGGLTTILEKSLGAVAKGGTTNLVDVYEYAEPVTAKGFVYMDTPGYDPVSATGQVAGGANLVCFTTGRGSAYGCKPAPSLKLATNTRLFEHQEEDMDLNCGGIVDGKESIAEVGQKLFELILQDRLGRENQERGLRLRRRRVRALGPGGDHVMGAPSKKRLRDHVMGPLLKIPEEGCDGRDPKCVPPCSISHWSPHWPAWRSRRWPGRRRKASMAPSRCSATPAASATPPMRSLRARPSSKR